MAKRPKRALPLGQVSRCGNTTGARLDKLAAFGLTTRPAALVRPPLLEECFASLECRVADRRLVRDSCFLVLEVVKAWAEPGWKAARTLHHRGRGLFMVAGRSLRLRSARAQGPSAEDAWGRGSRLHAPRRFPAAAR
jgi:flavin reductase (DIM6/NTAB) family NADH-FMN oxidoreductase RutF